MSGGPHVTAEEIETWDKLLTEGWSYEEISRTTGRAWRTIQKHLPGRGWSHQQCVEHGILTRNHNRKMQKAAA